MNGDWSLPIIGVLAGFFLKTTLAFGLCAALSRLVASARLRFVLWSSFVYGSAAYWLCLAILFWTPHQQPAFGNPGALAPSTSSSAVWLIPSSLAFPLGLTLRIAGGLYLLTMCYFTFSHLRKRNRLKWVLSFTTEPPAEIAETFCLLAKELDCSHSRLLLLSGVTSPATFGWLRPIILLPSSCMQEDSLDLEDILRHELQHVHRRDAVWNGLAVAARGLLCFHPAVWHAVRSMQGDRELACDSAVVARSPARRAAYAECLVRFAKLHVFPEQGGWGMDFAASTHHLTVRVHSILQASHRSPHWVRCLRVASGLSMSALFVGVAPSLAILLSFAQPPVSATAFTPLLPSRAAASPGQSRTSTRSRFLVASAKERRPASSGSAHAEENVGSATEMDPVSEPMTPALQTDSGPQLRRRGDASAVSKAGTSQTIALTDTGANGKPAESGDRKQAVQQTATAALGIYQRISAIDRH